MIPVIDFEGPNVLKKIEEAYTTVGFAVFTNSISRFEKATMNSWSNIMKQFFELPLEKKMQYSYEGVDTNVGYTMWLKENVDPKAPKDMKESFNYNDKRTTNWPKEIPDFWASNPCTKHGHANPHRKPPYGARIVSRA